MIIRNVKEDDFESVNKLIYQIYEKHLIRRSDIYINIKKSIS